jgi:hypothetical protein
MPKFFVPQTENAAEAEKRYQAFCKTCPYGLLLGRLFSVGFVDKGRLLTAEVGKTIEGWPGRTDPVYGIIESAGGLQIYTLHRGVQTGRPILVSRGDIRARRYFDDYPGYL